MSILSFSNVKKTWYYLQKNGLKAAYLAALERLSESRKQPYAYEAPSEETLARQRKDDISAIRFSVVVPAYETNPAHLRALLDSLHAQTYGHWELILADASAGDGVKQTLRLWQKEHASERSGIQCENEAEKGQSWADARIRYLKLSQNGGISVNTNAGIAAAAGDYIGLLDHDDLLTPDALYEVAAAIEQGKKTGRQPRVLYSDEDKCDGTGAVFYEPNRKTDFNLDLLLSNNYICHFLVMESALMKELLLRADFDGAQDYDLVLRAALRTRELFTHVPKVLYHWRCHNDSTAANPRSKAYAYEAGKRAVEDFCRQKGWNVNVSDMKHLGFYRVDYREDIFEMRPEVGAVAGPLPDRHFLVSGIYEVDGSMRYAGLKKGFSGPMHRAALQQDVAAADLRSLRVRRELKKDWEKALREAEQKGISGGGKEERSAEARYCRASLDFCRKLEREGYLILWDPMHEE